MHIVNNLIIQKQRREKERKRNFKEWISENAQTLKLGHTC